MWRAIQIGQIGGQYLGKVAIHREFLGEPAGRRASWSPEMIAMCSMPRSRRPWTMVMVAVDDALGGALELRASVRPEVRGHRVALSMDLVESLLHLAC